MAVNEDSYYSGSHTFDWLSDRTGIPVDQSAGIPKMQSSIKVLLVLVAAVCYVVADPWNGFNNPPRRPPLILPIPTTPPFNPRPMDPSVNFVTSQFTSLFLAGILRTCLKPQEVGPVVRHSFGLIAGLLLGYFCFGRQAVHLAGLPALCYIVIRTQDPRYIQRIVFVLALGYLSCVHIYRQIYAYGSYTLDITGPLMVITQKVTSVAYSIHDGVTRPEKDLTPLQRQHAVKIMPTALEYFGFIFQFQTLMAGPVIYYRDYIDFIHGNNLKGSKSFSGFYDDASNQVNVLEPSPTKAVVKKIIATLACAVLFMSFIPMFPLERVKENGFLENTGLLYKFVYLTIVLIFIRIKYYYAWLFADAICNNSGMGFNGLDDYGNEKWDGISNVDHFKFELSMNLKDATEAWNKGTNKWLREIVYERAKKHKLILTFAISAVWHGFYPGYYLTFATGALFTYAARSARRKIRPLFVGSAKNSFIYDVLTFTATRIGMTYLAFTFVLLEFTPSVRVYKSLYLIPHLMALAIIALASFLPSKPHQIKQNGNINEPLKKPLTCDTNITNNDQAEIRNGTIKKMI